MPAAAREVTGVSGRNGPPAIVTAAGKGAFAYAEFFGAEIESLHTCRAYRHAVDRFLMRCEEHGYALHQISPALLGDYIRYGPPGQNSPPDF